MRHVQVMNTEEEWQEMDESYEECVSPFSQDSEGSFVLSPNTIKVRCQPSPQTADVEEHLLLCLNCRKPRAKGGKLQHKAGEKVSAYSVKIETCGCEILSEESQNIYNELEKKECVSPSADEIYDREELNCLSQRRNSDEKAESQKNLVKKDDSTMEWESRQNGNDNDSENLCVEHLKDDECDGEILKGESQQAYNEKHGVYPVKSQISSNKRKIDEREVEWELRQAHKEETSACLVTTKPCEYEAKTHKRGSEWEMRQADNNNEEICDCPKKERRTLKWCVPLTDSEDVCASPKVSNPCERRLEKEDQRALESKTSQFDSEDPCASPIIRNAYDREGKKDQGAFACVSSIMRDHKEKKGKRVLDSKKPWPTKAKTCECETKKDQRTLKWCVPLTDNDEKDLGDLCEREEEGGNLSQFNGDELCVHPAKPANQSECKGKDDQRGRQSKLSQSDSDLQKMTRVAYAFKDKPFGYQAKKDQRSLKWCNPLIANEKPPCVYSAKTEPCEYRAKKGQEGSEWALRQKENDKKNSSIYSTKLELEAKKNQRTLESDRPRADNEKTCAYGEEKDQQAVEWDIPRADDEKEVCIYPLKTDACEYEKKKDQSSALESELRKHSSVCSSKASTSSECGTKPDQLPMEGELRERQPAVNDNEQSCANTLGPKSSECGAREEDHSTFQCKLRDKDNNRDLFNTLKKEYEERFAYLEGELRNYHASVLTGNDKISTMDQRMQTVIREKQMLEQKLKQSHSGQEQLDVLRKHYEDRITRLEQDLHNYQLSANTHNSKIAELEKRMQSLVKEKQLLEEEVKQKAFDMEKTVLDDNKLALRHADDRDRICELEKSMQALLKEKEFLEDELKQKGCNAANNDRLKDELHDCKRIVRSGDDEITKLEERMQKLKQEKELLELAFKKKEDQLRALQEKEKCNDNEHTRKEFDVCKLRAEAAIAKAAALNERKKTLGQEKEFVESKLRINFLDLCDFLKEIESVQEVRCKECGRVKNLYICLSCGHFGCCRETGAHALAHYRATKHNLAKKLGSALVYNYECQKFVKFLSSCTRIEHIRPLHSC
uniref:UBP-type domain-containing protein n=1 Tax=Glossina pallidipes TaxID=7398 RepID=A0A1A9ZHL2_GLOPL